MLNSNFSENINKKISLDSDYNEDIILDALNLLSDNNIHISDDFEYTYKLLQFMEQYLYDTELINMVIHKMFIKIITPYRLCNIWINWKIDDEIHYRFNTIKDELLSYDLNMSYDLFCCYSNHSTYLYDRKREIISKYQKKNYSDEMYIYYLSKYNYDIVSEEYIED